MAAGMRNKGPFEGLITAHSAKSGLYRREVFAEVIKKAYDQTNKRFGTNVQPPEYR